MRGREAERSEEEQDKTQNCDVEPCRGTKGALSCCATLFACRIAVIILAATVRSWILACNDHRCVTIIVNNGVLYCMETLWRQVACRVVWCAGGGGHRECVHLSAWVCMRKHTTVHLNEIYQLSNERFVTRIVVLFVFECSGCPNFRLFLPIYEVCDFSNEELGVAALYLSACSDAILNFVNVNVFELAHSVKQHIFTCELHSVVSVKTLHLASDHVIWSFDYSLK